VWKIKADERTKGKNRKNQIIEEKIRTVTSLSGLSIFVVGSSHYRNRRRIREEEGTKKRE